MAQNLLIGCRGFENAPWTESFYPPELPADWRFCYYSNEIRALLVPAEESARLDAARVEAWRRDGDPDFRFVFELPGTALRPADIRGWRALLEPLWPRIAAFVLKAGGAMPPADIEDALGRPCCLEAAASIRADLSRVWHPDRDAVPAAGGRFLAAELGHPKPGQLRYALEGLARWTSAERGAALFLTGPETGPDDAREARLLAELMGL